MEQFCIGHASADHWPDALQQALSQLGTTPAEANLGFVYVTDPMAANFAEIIDTLRSKTGVAHWVGTVGLGVCATGVEYYEQPAISIMTGAFGADTFRVFGSLTNGMEKFDKEHDDWCSAHDPYFAVVHADPRNGHVTDLVSAVGERMSSGFLVGGLASARQEFVHVADTAEQGGLSGVMFDASVSVSIRLSQGCSLLGSRHEITRGEQNLIAELDGRPALDVLKEEVGEVIARDLSKASGYIFVALPIEGDDTGDYLVRHLVGVDPSQGIIAIGDHIAVGDTLMFCRRDGASAVEDMQRMLGEIKRGLRAPPRGAIYASCIGRGINLFGSNSEEAQMIASALGPIPLVGFYANGEICHDRLYAYTGVLTLFT